MKKKFTKIISINLVKTGDKREVREVIIGKDNQEFDVNVNVSHNSKNTYSRVFIKAVLYDSAKLNFLGNIKINKNASGSDSFLTQKTLVLGENNVVNSIPQLEIENNNVKCSHAVTISRPNKEHIFYLTSRGISKEKAAGLIVEGFLRWT